MISLPAIRAAVNRHVDTIIDDLVEAGDPIDSHPLQVDGLSHADLEDRLVATVVVWVSRLGIEVRGQ